MRDTATFALQTRGAVPVLMVEGSIDLLTAPTLRRRLTAALQRYEALVVDMSAVDFFDSTGVDVLISTTDNSPAAVSLIPSPAVSRILDILGRPSRSELSAGAVHA